MKLIGAALIAASALLTGAYLSGRLKGDVSVCEDLLLIMKYVRDEIAVNFTPTKTILSRASELFGVTGAAEKGLYAALEERLTATGGAEREIFSQFCSQIGRGDAESQKSRFDALIARFSELLAAKRAKISGAGRLYYSVSLFFGALLIIILF